MRRADPIVWTKIDDSPPIVHPWNVGLDIPQRRGRSWHVPGSALRRHPDNGALRPRRSMNTCGSRRFWSTFSTSPGAEDVFGPLSHCLVAADPEPTICYALATGAVGTVRRDGAHLGKGTRRASGQPRGEASPSESGAEFSSDSSIEAMRAYSRARTGHVHASMRSGCARGAGSRR